MTLEVGSCSLSSSQNTAGFRFHIKKKGMRGKKKPMRTPWSTVVEAPPACESVADPALSMESIHCSSSDRACSSSNWYTDQSLKSEIVENSADIPLLFQIQGQGSLKMIGCGIVGGSSRYPLRRNRQMQACQIL